MKISATPTKLRSGNWGARVTGPVKVGDVVTITTKGGKSWDAEVTTVVWTDGKVSICATASLDAGSRSAPSRTGSRSRGRWTGCACGSREDSYGNLIPSDRNCASCEHDA